MPYKYNGKVLRVGKAWMDANGITHPTNWASWSDDTKASMGITFEEPPAPHDSRFYWGRTAEGDLIPREIEDIDAVDAEGNPILDDQGVQVITKGLKTTLIEKVKSQAGGLLTPTDWMIIKAAEVDGYTVPADILTYRADVRAASNTIEAAIVACTSLDEIIALHDTPVDGNAPINDWPEVI